MANKPVLKVYQQLPIGPNNKDQYQYLTIFVKKQTITPTWKNNVNEKFT